MSETARRALVDSANAFKGHYSYGCLHLHVDNNRACAPTGTATTWTDREGEPQGSQHVIRTPRSRV